MIIKIILFRSMINLLWTNLKNCRTQVNIKHVQCLSSSTTAAKFNIPCLVFFQLDKFLSLKRASWNLLNEIIIKSKLVYYLKFWFERELSEIFLMRSLIRVIVLKPKKKSNFFIGFGLVSKACVANVKVGNQHMMKTWGCNWQGFRICSMLVNIELYKRTRL